jgi:aminocarboxymuconate-semialdehyde decarboxylase
MQNSPYKVDVHAHILPESLPNLKERYGYGDDFIYLDHYKPGHANMMKADGTFFRAIDAQCWDPREILRHMDRHGVKLMALSTVPVLFYYWAEPAHTHEWSQYINNHLATIQRDYEGRFVGLGTLPMQDVALATEELLRCHHELNLPGVEIGTHIESRNLDDEYYYPFYETAEKLGMCIFVHPWDMMGMDRMPKYFLPWLVGMPAETSLAICSMIFGGIFKKFPKLRVLFAHGGGCFPGTLGRISHGFHARPDLCNIHQIKDPREYVKSFYIDSLVHDEEALRTLLKMFGPERIALGSDFPFPLGDLEHGRYIELMKDLDQRSKEQMLTKTALEWLGINKADTSA